MDIFTKARGIATSASHSFQASWALHASRAGELRDDLVFVDSRKGIDLAGNMLRVMLEIRHRYGMRYRLVCVATREKHAFVRGMLDAYGLSDVRVVRYLSPFYFAYLERARYVFADCAFPPPYLKREGQIVVNTWHGTPLKRMGLDNPFDRVTSDNMQRSFLFADYLLFPSKYCMDVMSRAYALEGLYGGTVLLEGYPRNAIFFDSAAPERVRERFCLQGKRVYAYLPTWRQGDETIEEQAQAFAEQLRAVDALLGDDEVMYLRLHNLMQAEFQNLGVDFAHIVAFPQDIETYEFLSAVDCLVTDYSSVFYDYANCLTGKIVLFTYDEDVYADGRGTYEQPVAAPFPKVTSAEELVAELRSPRGYDDAAFRAAYCTYDDAHATERLVRTVFEGSPLCKAVDLRDRARKNVLVYGGSLEHNGVTASLLDWMDVVPDTERYVLVYSGKQLRGRAENLDVLPQDKQMLCVTGSFRCATPLELCGIVAYYMAGIDAAPARALVDRYFTREASRCLGGTNADVCVQFAGCERFMVGLFQRAPGLRVLWVHDDASGGVEASLVGRRGIPALRWAYGSYDRVVCAADWLVDLVRELGAPDDRVRVVPNWQDFALVRKRATEPIRTQEATVVELDGHENIESFLAAHATNVVAVGRFTPESEYALLIRSFERFSAGHEGVGLTIVGGYGPAFDDVLAQARASACSSDIMIVRNIENSLPILARCDLLVLPSVCGGQSTVLVEAAALGIPVAVGDASGVAEFVREGGGLVIERSDEGFASVMEKAVAGDVPRLQMDEERHRRLAVDTFLSAIGLRR